MVTRLVRVANGIVVRCGGCRRERAFWVAGNTLGIMPGAGGTQRLIRSVGNR